MGMRRGIVRCSSCGWFQPWFSKSLSPKVGDSSCRKCGRRNRFKPDAYATDGSRRSGFRHGRKSAVAFFSRPDWDPKKALAAEAQARNLRAKEGVFVDIDAMIAQERERLRERVQNRVDQLQELVE